MNADDHFTRGRELLQLAEDSDDWTEAGAMASMAAAHFAAAQTIFLRHQATSVGVTPSKSTRW